jgi:hypothetical protein
VIIRTNLTFGGLTRILCCVSVRIVIRVEGGRSRTRCWRCIIPWLLRTTYRIRTIKPGNSFSTLATSLDNCSGALVGVTGTANGSRIARAAAPVILNKVAMSVNHGGAPGLGVVLSCARKMLDTFVAERKPAKNVDYRST